MNDFTQRGSRDFFSVVFCVLVVAPLATFAASAEKRSLAPLVDVSATVAVSNGFQVTLFAGEPEVVQPIALAFDDRGRLWVAECHTYADAKVNFDLQQRDRIIILEDTNHDGHFDRRKVFWDQGQRLTSVEIGFGGVWVLCAPQMLFLPDRNGDDVPDGPPEVLLDGWDAGPIRHNIVNGLKWGPDGWLYGRHGIQATSSVGPPGGADSTRTRLNAAIWRYHPTRRTFEVVCQGTTNPWGHDWDEHGQLFFINTVIGHFWHGIPGAYFKRMYGEHLQPRRYELIDQHADHYHWDTGKTWMDSRAITGLTDTLGGGHAHCGMMIYLGDNWPAPYRGGVFTVNLHGYRLNHDRLERRGSGYVARHEADFIKFNDSWFRGIEMAYGPDGGVYLLDWSDMGECHENDADGVHRETGRIFKITYGETKKPAIADVAQLSDSGLVKLQLHSNEWYARHARRVLQERAAAGRDLTAARNELLAMFDSQTETSKKLRAMWSLQALASDGVWLNTQLQQTNEHIRAWAIRLLSEHGLPTKVMARELERLAQREPSALVRLSLASALQSLPLTDREPLATALLNYSEDAQDHNLPLMLWYGIEPLVSSDLEAALRLAQSSKIPLLRQFISRWLTEEISRRLSENPKGFPAHLNLLLVQAGKSSAEFQLDVLRGMSDALRGWRKAPKPTGWESFQKRIVTSNDPRIMEKVRELNVVFGDGRAIDEIRRIAVDPKASGDARRQALRQLIEARPPDLLPRLKELMRDRLTAGVAISGLALFDEPEIPALVLSFLHHLSDDEKNSAISMLASRRASATALLAAVQQGRLPRSQMTAYHARQVQSLGDAELNQQLTRAWGEVRGADTEKKRLSARYQELLTPARLKQADLLAGRALFNQVCASCHKLFGEGGNLGPDLTGSGRGQLDYLLENIVDPSAVVPADFKMAVVELKDGRVLNGVISARNERTITLLLPTERLVLERSEITETRESALSIMPESLLEALTETQMRDLIAYLMSPQQVALPAAR